MAEALTLIIFCIILAVCFILGVPLTPTLFLGFLVFCTYVLYKKFSVKELWNMVWGGIITVKNVIPVFLLIGLLTAYWRSAGTIASIVSYLSGAIQPGVILVITFILCSVVSVLTGTSFGTVATMGIICMTMGRAMGVNPAFLGGAIMSGIYFGDRCSPISSSAHLIADLTKTDIYDNVKLMAKDAVIPFILVSAIYACMGLGVDAEGPGINVREVFSRELVISPLALIPAGIILILAIFRFNVRMSMSISLLTGAILTVILQKREVLDVFKIALFGYSANDSEVAVMMNGGGLLGMIDVILVLILAGAFGGIFKGTELLSAVKRPLQRIAEKGTNFASVFCAALGSGFIACDQMLTILMTHQLTEDIEKDKSKLAIGMENSAALFSAMMPWSIGNRVPLTTIGAPRTASIFAFFLYLMPIYALIVSFIKKGAKNNEC